MHFKNILRLFLQSPLWLINKYLFSNWLKEKWGRLGGCYITNDPTIGDKWNLVQYNNSLFGKYYLVYVITMDMLFPFVLIGMSAINFQIWLYQVVHSADKRRWFGSICHVSIHSSFHWFHIIWNKNNLLLLFKFRSSTVSIMMNTVNVLALALLLGVSRASVIVSKYLHDF